MKKALFAVAAVALLAVAAQAGEIKYHEWPCAPIPQEITTIPVVMDVGYWVRIKDQDKLKITLKQDCHSRLLGLHHGERRDQQLPDVLLLDRESEERRRGRGRRRQLLQLQRQPGEH